MTVNVVKLNNAIEVGTVIPMEECNGNIGRWVEDQLEDNGYIVNRGKGIDLPQMGIEVKTRKFDSTSGHTIGAMLPQDIIDNKWQSGNNIFDKAQKHYRVKHKVNELTGDNFVVSAQVYDFTDPDIQNNLKEAWDHCCGVLLQNLGSSKDIDYISGKEKWAYLELQENGYYQFRIPTGIMKKMESIVNSNRTKLFFTGV